MDALEYAEGTHTQRDVFEGLLRGEVQFWPGEKSAILTEIIAYPRLKALRFWMAGGDLDELRIMEKDVSEWAKELGCSRVEICGRRGWLKALDGYSESCTVMTRGI